MTGDRSAPALQSLVPPRFGKDHITLADWPIGAATFQHRRGERGEQRDFAEFVIERSKGMRQKVALESPSRIGLPTAGDHDTLVALLLVAKQHEFSSDIVRFMPWQLLQIMDWPRNQKSLRRLQASLKRLKAVTATYENVWYNRQTKIVESCLITGILAEAKIVFRKGRRAKGILPESYIQWTRHMHTSLEEGNVLDLDLDMYFSCRRPGTKHLLRHLNKVWHAGRKPKPYARDLKELACGHLGMTDCKDLKRNFQQLVAELESTGYLKEADPTVRYQKVRAGIWRVHLELHPDRVRSQRQRDLPEGERETKPVSDAATLVSLYHQHRFQVANYVPRAHELKQSQRLLQDNDLALLTTFVERIARTVEHQFRGEDLYFGAAVPQFINAIQHRQKRQHVREQHVRIDADSADEDAAIQKQKEERWLRRQQLLAQWSRVSPEEQAKYLELSVAHARSDFDRRRLSRFLVADEPPREALDEMERCTQGSIVHVDPPPSHR